jgi:hypothetical protein
MEKKESKLYSEEQLRNAIAFGNISRPSISNDNWIEEQTPIELPTDEEIDAYVKSTGYYGHCTDEFHEGIELGAKWMRDKIKGGNNE